MTIGIQKTGEPLFPLGRVVGTRHVMSWFAENGIDPSEYLHRHHTGDWGDLDDHDSNLNDAAITSGDRILSAYQVGEERIYIITEGDRSYTTVMFTHEY